MEIFERYVLTMWTPQYILKNPLIIQANVLVDENNEPRITDFGLARAIDSQGSTVSTSFKGKGTLRWQAPELLHASRFGEESSKLTSKSDVYAFSCLCLEVYSNA